MSLGRREQSQWLFCRQLPGWGRNKEAMSSCNQISEEAGSGKTLE